MFASEGARQVVPEQRHVWLPVRQDPGHRVSNLGLGSHEEVAIVSELEGQQVRGVLHQNLLPDITRFGSVPVKEGKQTAAQKLIRLHRGHTALTASHRVLIHSDGSP